MNIDKEKLSEKFKQQDWDYVFRQAKIITDFLLIQSFKIYDIERREDMSQECLENLQKKILQKKVDSDKNLFAFIWKNSYFRVLEILRKENNRHRIAKFIPYDTLEDTSISNYFDSIEGVGNKYVPNNLKELWAI